MNDERWRSVSWRTERRAMIDLAMLAVLVVSSIALVIFKWAL